MGRPDPNGCGHCGEADCRRPALKARLDALGKWSTKEELQERRQVRAAWMAARDLCESRPAVDWQAECRAVADAGEAMRDALEDCAGALPDGPLTDAAMRALQRWLAVLDGRAAARQPTPEVLAAAAELRRLSETPTGRAAARAREEWSQHLRLCEPCRAWAAAQRKAPRGTIVATARECAVSRRLLDVTEAAEKVHAEAQKKRAALPLVLVAWIEGMA